MKVFSWHNAIKNGFINAEALSMAVALNDAAYDADGR